MLSAEALEEITLFFDLKIVTHPDIWGSTVLGVYD
jgi:hypothetical protein